MIRVLIVEDEPPIARAVKQMIENLSDAFEVIGCETNGQAALLRMEEEEADVIITDIRMPVMDGLALIERLTVMCPNCLSVILSGHQDFSYAQTALRLGAFDYLLKPLAPDKLQDLLGRLEEAYTKNALQRTRGTGGANAIHSAHASTKADCWVLLACVGNWPLIPDDAMVPGAAFWKEHNPEKLIRLFLEEGEDVFALEGKVSTECVFILKKITPERMAQISQTLLAALVRLSPLPKTLYAAAHPVALWEAGSLIRSMRSKLYVKIKLCRSTLLEDSGPGDEPAKGALLDRPVAEVVEALCVKKSERLKDAVGSAVDKAIENEITQMEFMRFLDAIICDHRLISQFTAGLKLDLSEAVSNAVTPDGLKAELTEILDHFSADENKYDKKIMISQIEQYLSENYTKSISNEMLSALFGFVPSYISKIFRQHMGVSPAEYLAQLRIGKAKTLLETRSDLLVREVGLLVGYNDPYYFSKAFKKITGLWPTQYQEECAEYSRGADWAGDSLQ